MLHKDSTIDNKCVYWYSHSQQQKETRVTKFKNILEQEKPADVAVAEWSLGAGSYVVLDLQ
ncbi:hypothetical protein EV176_001091, partial [Coemansia sp. RSA 451]